MKNAINRKISVIAYLYKKEFKEPRVIYFLLLFYYMSFPINMRHQSAGGYSNHSTLLNMPYRSWKGTGRFSNPVGVTATHIRPLTNQDPGNWFPTGFGLPRPLKQYRKGTVVPTTADTSSALTRTLNRAVKSSVGSSLGGGSGGSSLIAQMQDTPGATILKENHALEGEGGDRRIDEGCVSCTGIGMVSDWMPNRNLTNNPDHVVTSPALCCNQQRKAIRRVLPTNTNIQKNYFTTTYMYLYNRCQTFQQRQFNYVAEVALNPAMQTVFQSFPFVTAKLLEYSKPGDPLSIFNWYVAQCNPNVLISKEIEHGVLRTLAKALMDATYIDASLYSRLLEMTDVATFLDTLRSSLEPEAMKSVVDYYYRVAAAATNSNINTRGCSRVYYKPNNPQFAQQGGVSCSTRILKLNVDTISTAAAIRKQTAMANTFFKDKTPACSPQTYIGNPFFFQGQPQNKVICHSQ